MARRKPLDTIWEIPDELCRRIEPILREFWPKKPIGRRVANWRKMLTGSSSDAERLPVGPTARAVRPKSTVHDWFQRWVEGGVFEQTEAVPVAECDELGGVQWRWQSAEAMLGKARFGGKERARIPPTAVRKGPEESPWSVTLNFRVRRSV